MPDEPLIPCALCGRGSTRRHLTRHHCLPRSEGGTVEHIELSCDQCHSMLHQTCTNETLAKVHPMIDSLHRCEELQRYLRWVRKQPITRRTRTAPRRQRL